MVSERELREELCEVGRLLWERDLVGAAEGNLSVRFGQNSILCTPNGLCKGRLKPDDMVIIDHAGRPIRRGNPSSEIRLHLKAYSVRPDCAAFIHAHPPTATGFALANQNIPYDVLPEAVAVLGPIALVPFAMPGTEDLPNAAAESMQSHNTLLLANHGAATMGSSLMDAFFRMETLERVAKVVLIARQVGEPKALPAAAVAQLREKFPIELRP